MKVEISASAERELSEAVSWYAVQRHGLDDRFLTEFRRAVDRVIAFPNAWAKVSRRSRRCRFTRFPYELIYQIREDAILILAVAHLHRRPGYWRARERE